MKEKKTKKEKYQYHEPFEFMKIAYSNMEEFAIAQKIDIEKVKEGFSNGLTPCQVVKFAKGTLGKGRLDQGKKRSEGRIYFDGNWYDSPRQFALQMHISYQYLNRRLKEGIPMDKAIEMSFARVFVERGIAEPRKDHLNKEYPSLAAMAREYKMKPEVLRHRALEGWTMEEALTIPEGISRPQYYKEIRTKEILSICTDHKNISYGSNKRMLMQYGISQDMFLCRMLSGEWTLQEALVVPKNMGVKRFRKEQQMLRDAGFEIEDEYLEVFLEKNGVTKYAYQSRIERGWTFAKAVSTPVTYHREAFDPVDHLGERFDTIDQMCAKHHVPRTLFNNRYYGLGWSVEKALTTPKMLSKGERKIKSAIIHKGLNYVHNSTLKSTYSTLGQKDEFDRIATSYTEVLNDMDIQISKTEIERTRYNFAIIKDGKVFAFIEYDNRHHFEFSQFFHQNYEGFELSQNKEMVKTILSEIADIPLLRVRYDQIGCIRHILDDLIENPDNYKYQHNTTLSEYEYWNELSNVRIA